MKAELYRESFDSLSRAQKSLLTELIEYACASLEPSPTKRELAERRYKAVGKWLSESDSPIFKSAEIYPQGSQRIGTTVKPLSQNEFDLDFICYLPNAVDIHPDICRQNVVQRLKENGHFKDLVSELNRGCRVDYADDFHLDITPSIPDQNNANEAYAISVPDKKLQEWKASNPKGYANYFDSIAELMPHYKGYMDRAILTEAVSNESIEELPEHSQFKGILRRSVQIMKRHRDLLFSATPQLNGKAPISIIITTLAAKVYQDIVTNNVFDNELEVLLTVVERMPEYIERRVYGNRIELWVPNPKNQYENFAEKWNLDPQRIEAFRFWHCDIMAKLRELSTVKSLQFIKARLEELLGESPSKTAIAKHYEVINHNREQQNLFVKSSGAVTTFATCTPVKANTFFGAHE
ncbi:nucleotidyltransferase [Pseudoalteromonas sp. MM17-2]|uniref:nucleotidyltransferase domain-containing protein n=1 Tax=Pseudoalteromonas sp. MM17-2 TaxID=2917753 RepID=UPI001EF5A33B|nr:nucleotidyltransferase [Pseudoalteromonas sp. MM17-2]MCG7545945.1 nucleotidyltransferase [Pseudoalteromonas sp. MM17-2]